MPTQLVRLEKDGPVGCIIFDRPPANAYNLALLKDLDMVIEQVRDDAAVRVVILRGNTKFFSAGADIKSFTAMGPEDIARFALFGHETVCKLERLPQITIAAIEGHAMGGGLEMALGCDFRFIARGAAKLAVPEVNIGAVPNMGGTQRLPRLIGKSRALEMLITGKQVSGEEALALGLVDRVYELADVLPQTMEFAKKLAQGPAVTIAMIKKSVNEGLEASLSVGLALERETGRVFPRTEDFQEGVKAFVEKRSPNFQGK